MPPSNYKADILLAVRICKKLLAGRKEVIEELYQKYHQLFLEFTQRRVFSFHRARPASEHP